MGTTKVRKLKVAYDGEFDFTLLAISSVHKDYRICFELNKILQLDFAQASPFVLKPANNNAAQPYSRHTAKAMYGREYWLLHNYSGENMLLPELKGMDFLLMISPPYSGDVEELCHHIRALSVVQSAAVVEVLKLKSRHNLLS